MTEWWEKEDYKGRVIVINDTVIPVPDDAIQCDICGAEIVVFPVKVVDAYTLCKNCEDKRG